MPIPRVIPAPILLCVPSWFMCFVAEKFAAVKKRRTSGQEAQGLRDDQIPSTKNQIPAKSGSMQLPTFALFAAYVNQYLTIKTRNKSATFSPSSGFHSLTVPPEPNPRSTQLAQLSSMTSVSFESLRLVLPLP